MTPRAVPPPIPASCHLPARPAAQSVPQQLNEQFDEQFNGQFNGQFNEQFNGQFNEQFNEPPIRRYAMHWLQQAAARINKRHERSQRQRLLTEAVLGIDHLFDLSDIPTRPIRRIRPLHGSDPGVQQAAGRA